MVCRVCKRDIDSPVCSFCGEDNTMWIEAAKQSFEAEKENASKKNEDSSPVRRVAKYKVDYKKLIRLVIALVAVVVFVVLVVSMVSSDEPKKSAPETGIFTDSMLAVKNGSEWGYISSENIGGYAIAPQYKFVTNYSGDIAFVYIGNKYAIINKQGQLLTEPSFEAVGNVSDGGYFAVKSDGKWGYIHKDDTKYAIEPKFSTAGVFREDCAVVSVNGLYGYIGTDGEYIIAPQYDFALDFSDGYAPIHTGGKWGYINKNGETTIEPVYDEAQGFCDGMAIVNYYGDYGVINKDGSFVVAPQFDEMTAFDSDEIARVRIGTKYGYINKDGEYIINPAYRSLGNFNGEELTYAMTADGKFGFVNKKGEFKIDAVFDDAGEFSNGLAPVKLDGLWGYINTDGEMIIQPAFLEASSFYDDGYGVVVDELGKYQIINKEGTGLFGSGVNVDGVLLSK